MFLERSRAGKPSQFHHSSIANRPRAWPTMTGPGGQRAEKGGLEVAWAGRPEPPGQGAKGRRALRRLRSWPLRSRKLVLSSLVASSVLAASIFPATAASALPRARRHRRPAPAVIAKATAPSTSGLTALPLPSPPPTAPADTCVKASWDATVLGIPADFAAGPTDKLIFAGSITALTGQFIDVTPVSNVGTDIVALSPDKRTIYFRLVDFGLLDGLNFATRCSRAFTVDIHAGGRLLTTSATHLGATAANPPSNPFKVGRGALLAARAKLPPARS